MRLKMAVFAPMPSARDRIATVVINGFFRAERKAYLKFMAASEESDVIEPRPMKKVTAGLYRQKCPNSDYGQEIAAERRQSVAPGVSPGFSFDTISAPEGRKSLSEAFAPPGLRSETTPTPGLRPGLHSVAAPRLNRGAGFSAPEVPSFAAGACADRLPTTTNIPLVDSAYLLNSLQSWEDISSPGAKKWQRAKAT